MHVPWPCTTYKMNNWNISDYGTNELLLESGKQKFAKQDCHAGTLALWIHCCWGVWCDGLSLTGDRAICLPPRAAPMAVEGPDGFAVPRYTQPRSIHLPVRNAKENAQTCHTQMWRQLQDKKDHIQKACQYEKTLRSWDKLKKTMHKREGLISLCEDYLSQKSVCYRLILQLPTDSCQLASPSNFTCCLKFLR